MLKWLAENWIPLVLQLSVFPAVIFILSSKVWLNRKIRIKRVNPERINKIGDLSIDEHKVIVRFFWSKRILLREEITELSGFSTDDFASETGEELISVKFERNATIVFDSKDEEQIKVVELFRKQLDVKEINWDRELIHGTEEQPVIFFKKQH